MSPNLVASIQARLLAIAKRQGEDFTILLSRFAGERFLYRLSQSEYKDRFILKGATLFLISDGILHRPTRDIDLLGFFPNDQAALEDVFRSLCRMSFPADGLTFLANTIASAPIREEQEYQGIRVTMTAMLGKMRCPLQVDIGFGDSIIPAPTEVKVPVLLDLPAPILRAYAPETSVAEKLHAIVIRGIANSRMKDYFDLWYWASNRSFDGDRLTQAIHATLERRQTAIPEELPFGLSDDFARDTIKRQQWDAFLNRNRLQTSDSSFQEVVRLVQQFAWEPLTAVRTGIDFKKTWQPATGWSK